jgi:ribosomal protein S18 acetylase RimI-like enzyme
MASQQLDIKLATPDDLALVSDIYSSVCLWLHDVKGITEMWSREVSAEEMQELIDSNQLYLALIANEAAGAFKLTEQDRLWDHTDNALYVHAFAVHRKFEGMGIGKKMLDWAGDLARKRGKRYLRLDCMDENSELKQYYVRAGFELLGMHPQNSWSALFQKEVSR